MTLLEQHFEGQTDGAPVTIAASTAYGDSPTSQVLSQYGTVLYSTADDMHGTRCVQLIETATSARLSIGLGGFSSNQVATRVYIKFSDLPSSKTSIVRCLGTGLAEMGGLYLYHDGTVGIADVNNVTLNASSPTTQALKTSTWYRFEVVWNISTTAGSYKVAIYQGDAATSFYSYSSATNLNSGTTPIVSIRTGKDDPTSTMVGPWRVDDFAVNTSATAFIGPYVQPGPSIASNMATGFVQLDLTQSSPVAGGILTYSISPSTGVTQSPSGVFYIPQKAANTPYTVTVSERSGGTSSKVVLIPAPVSGASSASSVITQQYVAGAWT